ncbi:MAG TPA: hypothetical protein VHN74_18370 [Candidatus Angelobacter sp.]|jgi:hypothetical protein|nr:hypothetical protein [Candidatus Angelobacter sp.]
MKTARKSHAATLWSRLPLTTFLVALLLVQSSETFPLTTSQILSRTAAHPAQKASFSPTPSSSPAPVQVVESEAQTPVQPGNPWTGEQLFIGRLRFANGGPPCVGCHSASGIPFPNGGTMGPNLTDVYTRFGPEGITSALDTLFFVTMQPLYDKRPLILTEQQDLAAFFRRTAQNQQQRGLTAEFGLVSLAAGLGLLVLNGFIWKKRLQGVRRNLVMRVER